jgi:hypothetical protein
MNLHFTCKFIQNTVTPTLGAATLDQRLAERTRFFLFILRSILASCLALLCFPSNDEGWEPGSTGGMERAAAAALGDVAPLAAQGSSRWHRGRAGPGRTPWHGQRMHCVSWRPLAGQRRQGGRVGLSFFTALPEQERVEPVGCRHRG